MADGTKSESKSNFLAREVLDQLIELGEPRTFAPGDVLFRKGDPGDSMFVVVRGEVGILFDDVKDPKRLGEGSVFGELALLSGGQTRTATVIASCACELKELGQTAFDALLARDPQLVAQLLRGTCSYLVGSEQALIHDLRRRNRELEQNIDFLRRTREELDVAQMRAQTDELTGLYNRRCLDNRVKNLAGETAEGSPVTLLLVDLDRFKEINDTHGHAVGDLVLKRVAALLRRSVRQSDLPVRIGGDEFALLLVGIPADKSMVRAQSLLDELCAIEIVLPHTTIAVGASVGGTAARPGETWDAVFERADTNLYAAKGAGRNRLGWDDRGGAAPVTLQARAPAS